jgi:KDO2-lipid IV(A) lauroyltransferase
MVTIQKRIKNDLVYLFVRLIVAVVKRIPRRPALFLGALLGWCAFFLLRRERRRVVAGLTRAFGGVKGSQEIEAVGKRSFLLLGKNMIDTLSLCGRREQLLSLVRIVGLHHLDAVLALGKGCIGITGHIGSWELLAMALAAKGYTINAVARDLRDPRLHRFVAGMRGQGGVRVIARGRETREILRALARNEIVGMLIDQDTKVDGVFIDFFGVPAYTPTGPVLLALKTGASIVPAAIRREIDDTHTLHIGEPIPLEVTGDREQDLIINTARCSQAIERFIRDTPEQWVWFHQRWRTEHSTRRVLL